MKASLILSSVFLTFGLATPTLQATPVPCSGNQKSHVLLDTEYNLLGSPSQQTNIEIFNGGCLLITGNLTGIFDNSVSSLSPNGQRGLLRTLYDFPNCPVSGDRVTFTGRVNDLRLLRPNLDNRGSSILCT
ncbi:hypothetical protein BU23DRAFT_572819 [Bimuria novae-zelandiae CBS 107.79]|uniref:Uncharacterized protein n=1 Tax=Bimuria novae-zelandiae CBS 107.79 TaxID=1447943 RepID=A0A6A5URM5_9PLEO|nr:hypothetical protein BU23DRAFT_572819 [Bimuria novae-zelandiae CBS 107.79]